MTFILNNFREFLGAAEDQIKDENKAYFATKEEIKNISEVVSFLGI